MGWPERTLPSVLDDMAGHIRQILHGEVRLAVTEVKEDAAKAGRAALALAAGIFLSFYAVGFLLLACVYALSTLVAPWLASVLVAAVVAVAAVAFISAGRKKLQAANLGPDKTVRSIKENVQWAKQRIR
jgi:uncharacterized membrane protein YqjE